MPLSTGRARPRPISFGLAAAILGLTALFATGDSLADASLNVRRPGVPGMPPPGASVLIDCFERFLAGNDVERFRREVYTRYNEGTLARLTHADDVRSRRAAVLGLGLTGSFSSNATVARLLKDPDPIVRSLSTDALWAIWYRADTPENNEELGAIRGLLAAGRFDEAIGRADLLTARSPAFAEAYNQRAIAYYLTGRFAESANDCRRTLELNPYHVGALSGLGQCQVRLRLRPEAIRTFRRALALEPYSRGLRETVAELEAAGD